MAGAAGAATPPIRPLSPKPAPRVGARECQQANVPDGLDIGGLRAIASVQVSSGIPRITVPFSRTVS